MMAQEEGNSESVRMKKLEKDFLECAIFGFEAGCMPGYVKHDGIREYRTCGMCAAYQSLVETASTEPRKHLGADKKFYVNLDNQNVGTIIVGLDTSAKEILLKARKDSDEVRKRIEEMFGRMNEVKNI